LSNGGGADVIAGDNARVLFTGATNSFDGALTRSVRLFDIETPASAASVDVHDVDTVFGGDGNDRIFGQGANDNLNGDNGDDAIEGDHGADAINGGTGQDDIVGGSATAGYADGGDTIHGNDGADVVLADNGVITRPLETDGSWLTLGEQNGNQNAEFQVIVVRTTTIATTPEVSGAFGNDSVFGDGGADELIGQQGNDVMQGNAGSDAIVGDLGKITTTLENGGRATTATANAPFMSSPVFVKGTLTRQVQLFSFTTSGGAAGNDVLLGGSESDSVHGGGGVDLINGNVGDDYLFGGDGDDVVWGGPGNDDAFGGNGNDHMDVVPRPTDPASWHTYGDVDHLQGLDLLYGGFDQDTLQADFQENGPGAADRLVDWAATYNAYFICRGGGAGTVIRSPDPATILYLQQVAEARGAFQVKTPATSSGFNETAIVFTGDIKNNTSPANPEGRGTGVCPP
jgi:Ca2+-binding RTX toxin-like protein